MRCLPGNQIGNMAKEWAKPFYNSMAWKAKRQEILRRDHFTCELCEGRGVEIHHEIELTPENIADPTITLNNALLHTLCHDCHAKITNGAAFDCDEGFYFDDEGQLVPWVR